MSDSGWTKELAAEHNDKYEREVERLREVGKRLLSEQERVRAAKGFVGALSEMARPFNSFTAPEPKPTRKPRAHPERDLEKACSDLLQLDGWRLLRCEPVSRREWGRGFGEVGMADCLYIRYLVSSSIDREYLDTAADKAQAEILWIEYKSEAGKATQAQGLWHAAERARGALTWIAGQEFLATVDGFLEHYRNSGLMRRKL